MNLKTRKEIKTPLVDCERFTNYNRGENELSATLFFSVAVAGKTAVTVCKKVNALFEGVGSVRLFLGVASRNGELMEKMKDVKLGKYSTLNRFARDFTSSGLNLGRCTLEDLVSLHGIKYKTANMFLLHTRRGYEGVVLDTHILRYMREELGLETPKKTPDRYGTYKKYSDLFIAHAKDIGKNLATLDSEIWNKYARK